MVGDEFLQPQEALDLPAPGTSTKRGSMGGTLRRNAWWSSTVHAGEEVAEVVGDEFLQPQEALDLPAPGTSTKRGSMGGTLRR
ncbi:hypothetical protein CTI14_67460, partial [Methylobacterium radiotolerans]